MQSIGWERLKALSTARSLAAAILISGFSVAVILNWPGQLSFDSIIQLHDGRTGHYGTWHPPVTAWLLGIADSIVRGTGLFILFDALLLCSSLVSLLALAQTPRPRTIAVALICIALPQIAIYQGIVWKDVLFADAAVAGFVLLAHAGAHWQDARFRFGLIASGFLLLGLAALARQNGAIVIAIGALAVGAVAGKTSGIRNALAYGTGALAAASVFLICANVALATRTYGPSGIAGQFTLLETYDIIGETKADPHLDLDIIRRANPDLEEEIRSDGIDLYTPQRNDTLAGSADLQNELSSTPPSVIAAQWRTLIRHRPWLYLATRANVFAWVFLTPDILRCVPYHVGVQGPDALVRELKLDTHVRPQDVALAAYADIFLHTPVFSHATFALLAGALLVLLFRRGRATDLAIAFMLVAALGFTLSFFLISIACDYRYLLFLDLSVLTAAFYAAATL